jgi:hypothetical protein
MNAKCVSAGHTGSNMKFISNDYVLDTDIVNKKLPVYDAMSCINNLLKQIVKANHKFYDPKKYFYSLTLKRTNEKRYLVVEVVRYKSSSVMDYIGAIKVSDAIFLCRGDIATDTLFKLNNDTAISVCLKSAEETDVSGMGMEPVLRGLYQECDKININIEIYTQAALPDYKMKER